MKTKHITRWIWVFRAELFGLGALCLFIALGAEFLGIDSGGDWGLRRVLLATAGAAICLLAIGLCLVPVRVTAWTTRLASATHYASGSAMWMLIALGAFELILRATTLHLPPEIEERGWRAVPVPGSTVLWGAEGFAVTRYLRHGEIATPVDAGAVSVVVLGDSQTEALQVFDRDKFASVAEAAVNRELVGRQVDLHNLGRRGDDVPDYVYLAPGVKRLYHPSIVVIQLSPLDFFGAHGRSGPNHFIVGRSGSLEFRHGEQSWEQATSSSILSLGLDRYKTAKKAVSARWSGTSETATSRGSERILPEAQLDDQLRLLRDAYSDTEVILVLLPMTPRITVDRVSLPDSEFERILSSARAIGTFRIVDPRQEFERLARQGHLPRGFMNSLPGEGHLNVSGNRVIGELLAQAILEIVR